MFANLYARYYDLLNKTKPYQNEIEFVYDWADQPKKILDIGCGTASYWQFYPEGTMIHGVDKSEAMIDKSGHNHIFHMDVETEYTKFKYKFKYDLVTALFDVINYIPSHRWWKHLPLKKGGYFIFDIWDKERIKREGFHRSERHKGFVTRVIQPQRYTGKTVDLRVMLFGPGFIETELHRMYLFSQKDIERFASKFFNIEDIKYTRKWQTWYKLRRK